MSKVRKKAACETLPVGDAAGEEGVEVLNRREAGLNKFAGQTQSRVWEQHESCTTRKLCFAVMNNLFLTVQFVIVQNVVNQCGLSTSGGTIYQHVLSPQQREVDQFTRLQVGNRVNVELFQRLQVVSWLGQLGNPRTPMVPLSRFVDEVIEHRVVCVEVGQTEKKTKNWPNKKIYDQYWNVSEECLRVGKVSDLVVHWLALLHSEKATKCPNEREQKQALNVDHPSWNVTFLFLKTINLKKTNSATDNQNPNQYSTWKDSESLLRIQPQIWIKKSVLIVVWSLIIPMTYINYKVLNLSLHHSQNTAN